MRNSKAIDLITEKKGKTFPIQVKSIYKKKNIGWPLLKYKLHKDQALFERAYAYIKVYY